MLIRGYDKKGHIMCQINDRLLYDTPMALCHTNSCNEDQTLYHTIIYITNLHTPPIDRPVETLIVAMLEVSRK